jgi:DNA-binding CsgD family transcriptional regulator
MTEKIKELLSSGYTTREVALILDIPYQIVLKVETEYGVV